MRVMIQEVDRCATLLRAGQYIKACLSWICYTIGREGRRSSDAVLV